MARLPRYITPGQPQHIIQRGNNRQVIFAAEADYQFFRDAVVEAAGRFGLGKMVSDPIYLTLFTPGKFLCPAHPRCLSAVAVCV